MFSRTHGEHINQVGDHLSGSFESLEFPQSYGLPGPVIEITYPLPLLTTSSIVVKALCDKPEGRGFETR
jgi:hypothetical protein